MEQSEEEIVEKVDIIGEGKIRWKAKGKSYAYCLFADIPVWNNDH